MKIGSLMIIIPLLFSLASCQVEETTGSSGLISGHKPATNSFSFQTPSAATYVTAETISLVLTFPFEVTVTNTPRLQLTIGAATRYANYASGTGTKNLTFSYTVVGTDNDTDGIAFAALELNGGTLTFDNNGTITNCSTTLAARTFSSVKVDNSGPVITDFDLSNIPGFYNVGDTLNFTMTFDEAVYVTGTPRFAVAFTTGGSVYAEYAGGSGTASLSFRYTVESTVADTDGYTITSPLELNAGTLEDVSGNAASLDFSAFVAAVQTYSATVDLDGRLPYVVSVTPPANGTYIAAQNLEFSVEFNRAVNVLGSPYINLTIGSTTRQAAYVSGSGTDTLVFSYTAIPGDVDSDGIAASVTITQNTGGNIIGLMVPTSSYFAVVANNVLNTPSTTGVLVEAVLPQALSVTRNTDITTQVWGGAVDNIFIIDQQLLITVTFNTEITVGQASGTPRIPLTIGAATRYANYLSGSGQSSLIFSYTIQEGDLDTDGSIGLASIDLNGGTLTDSASTNASLTLPSSSLATTQVDGERPTISSITAPADGTYSTVTGSNHLNMTFTVNWSEAVNYSSTAAAAAYVPTTIGATGVNLIYASGNNSAAIVHRASDLSGLNDSDGIALTSPFAGTATIKDRAGNSAADLSFTAPTTTGILVDTTAPTISSITPTNATYLETEDLDFTVNFDEPVTVSVSGGYPRIAMTIGSDTRYLVPTASGTASSHTFRYTVEACVNDYDGVSLSTFDPSGGGGYVRDAGQNDASAAYSAIDTTGVLINTPACITSITPPSDGTYVSGDTLTFTVNYNENVTEAGATRIQVTAQTGTLNFNNTAGTGTSSLTFSYTVTATSFDFNGLTAPALIDMNGGSIRDSLALNSDPDFPAAIDLSSVFISYPNIVVWTKGDFTNAAAPSQTNVTLSSTASADTCSANPCRDFDGDDTLSIDNGINSIQTVIVVLKTDSLFAGDHWLFDPIIQLVDNDPDWDISTPSWSMYTKDTGAESGWSNTVHAANLAANTTYVLRINYWTGNLESLAAGVIIPSTFRGSIAEIIITDGGDDFSDGRSDQIMTYLNSKY